jgi:hypothetical protein
VSRIHGIRGGDKNEEGELVEGQHVPMESCMALFNGKLTVVLEW